MLIAKTMAKNEPLRRYFFEIELMRKQIYPSIKDIIRYLEEHDINKSKRTVERDFEQIRNNFGIYIDYDSHKEGYYIQEDLSSNLDSFIRFLEVANTAQLLLKGISETKDFIKDIEFDLRGGLLGTENLQILLEAIKKQQKIRFLHYNYLTEEETDVLLDPYFLKEYLGRWYVVGLREDDKIRTFGIDRISDLVITPLNFVKSKDAKARENFDSIIGLVYSYGKPQKVIAVAAAEDDNVLSAVAKAKSEGIATAVLVGNRAKIQEIADEENIDIGDFEIIDEEIPALAAKKAVSIIRNGEAQILMKGMVGTADFLRAVLNKENGLREGDLLSHIGFFEIDTYHKVIALTDAAQNIAPDLKQKTDIIGNSLRIFYSSTVWKWRFKQKYSH